MFLPRPLETQPRRRFRDAEVENRGGEEEEAEEEELGEEAADDDVVARVDHVCILAGQQPGTGGLEQESEDVADDEEFGEPGAADEEGAVAFDHVHDSRQLHVD